MDISEIQIKFGMDTDRLRPLAATFRVPDRFPSWVVKSARYRLLLRSKSPSSDVRSITSRLPRKVSVIETLDALVILLVNDNAPRALRVNHLIEPTVVSDGNDRVDKIVRNSRSNVPPIWERVVLE